MSIPNMNDWLLGLDDEHRKMLHEDKWLLASQWGEFVASKQQPTIADYLESQKSMLDKTGAKVVTVESLKEFAGL